MKLIKTKLLIFFLLIPIYFIDAMEPDDKKLRLVNILYSSSPYSLSFHKENVVPRIKIKKEKVDNITKIQPSSYLDDKANVDQIDQYGNSMLKCAIDKQNLEMIKVLLNNKANVNQVDKYGDFMLNYAIDQENLEMVKFLLNYKANVDQFDWFGDSMLKRAIDRKNLEVFKVLLDYKADANQVDKYGNSMLRHAIGEKSLEIIKFFINNNANISQQDLLLAKKRGIEIILERKNRTLEEQKRVLTFLLCHSIYIKNNKHLKIPKPLLLYILFEFVKIPVNNKAVLVDDINDLPQLTPPDRYVFNVKEIYKGHGI